MSVTVEVMNVLPHSPADKSGFLKGDIVLSVNKNEIRDVLDYQFYTSEKKLSVEVHRGPEILTLKVSKDEYEDLGLEFETYLMDKKQTCRNKCIFCFIDQNPKGMRDTIYFKDDDSRMSFIAGNYITLTNMSDADVDRIIKQHISPINISVHTTNPELRCKMMSNKNAGKVLDYIKRFADAEIWMNMQIVLCPDINDGKELEKTLADLSEFVPAVQSIAIVPVGLTKYRKGLFPLRSFTKEECSEVIDLVEKYGDGFLEKFGTRLCYPSDEFYLSASRELPCEEFYEDFSQLDNGVGMIRSLLCDVERAVEDEKKRAYTPAPFSVATGFAAFDCIDKAIDIVCKKLYGKRDFVELYKIKNDFFGESVTVAGLVTGGDLISQLKGKKLGERLYIPKVMLRYEQDKFLDDVTLEEAKKELGVDIVPVDTCGDAFVKLFM